jgi:hypothetical protein
MESSLPAMQPEALNICHTRLSILMKEIEVFDQPQLDYFSIDRSISDLLGGSVAR